MSNLPRRTNKSVKRAHEKRNKNPPERQRRKSQESSYVFLSRILEKGLNRPFVGRSGLLGATCECNAITARVWAQTAVVVLSESKRGNERVGSSPRFGQTFPR